MGAGGGQMMKSIFPYIHFDIEEDKDYDSKVSQQFCPGLSLNILLNNVYKSNFLAFFILHPFFSVSSI